MHLTPSSSTCTWTWAPEAAGSFQTTAPPIRVGVVLQCEVVQDRYWSQRGGEGVGARPWLCLRHSCAATRPPGPSPGSCDGIALSGPSLLIIWSKSVIACEAVAPWGLRDMLCSSGREAGKAIWCACHAAVMTSLETALQRREGAGADKGFERSWFVQLRTGRRRGGAEATHTQSEQKGSGYQVEASDVRSPDTYCERRCPSSHRCNKSGTLWRNATKRSSPFFCLAWGRVRGPLYLCLCCAGVAAACCGMLCTGCGVFRTTDKMYVYSFYFILWMARVQPGGIKTTVQALFHFFLRPY